MPHNFIHYQNILDAGFKRNVEKYIGFMADLDRAPIKLMATGPLNFCAARRLRSRRPAAMLRPILALLPLLLLPLQPSLAAPVADEICTEPRADIADRKCVSRERTDLGLAA